MNGAQVSQDQDRRGCKRIPASFGIMLKVKSPFHVRAEFKEMEIDAIAQDLGERGISMITNGVIPVDTRVEMKFKIFNEPSYPSDESHRAFELQGDVRYSMITDDTDYRLGIEFVTVSEAERKFITDCIQFHQLRSRKSAS